MTEFLFLCLGLLGLWLGSDVLVRGAIAIADRLSLSDAVVGMLILAVGTDIPELLVAVQASLHSLEGEDMSGIVIGSALGSCIGQFGLVIGVAGFLGFSPRPFHLIYRNAFFLLGGLAALLLFSFDGQINRAEGVSLIIFYSAYIFTLIKWPGQSTDMEQADANLPLAKGIVYLAIGLVVLLGSAELTVHSAVGFAESVGLSHLSVSAILIGMGSSLPELSVSLVALFRKRGGLSVGNLMGSNVLDSVLVPGVAAVITPILVPVAVLSFDIPMLSAITLLVLGFLYISPRGVRAPEAGLLLVMYLGYASVRLIG